MSRKKMRSMMVSSPVDGLYRVNLRTLDDPWEGELSLTAMPAQSQQRGYVSSSARLEEVMATLCSRGRQRAEQRREEQAGKGRKRGNEQRASECNESEIRYARECHP